MVADRLKLEDLQSFEDLFAPRSKPEETRQEQRRSDRKAVQFPGHIAVDGFNLEFQTVDLSLGGVSLRASKSLSVGKEADINFVLADGQTVVATVRIVYCFFTQVEDFRAGMQFLSITRGAEALTRFLSE